MTFPANEAQVDDIAKGADPTTHIRILGSDGWRTVDRDCGCDEQESWKDPERSSSTVRRVIFWRRNRRGRRGVFVCAESMIWRRRSML